jgi:hypothetical protein
MTVPNTLLNEFPPVDMDFLKSRTTPGKKLGDGKDRCDAVVSPSSSSVGPSVSASSNSSVSFDLDEPLFPSSSSTDEIVRISDHKVAERDGLHVVEPLLRENPNRFVLFPIQDNDVSVITI